MPQLQRRAALAVDIEHLALPIRDRLSNAHVLSESVASSVWAHLPQSRLSSSAERRRSAVSPRGGWWQPFEVSRDPYSSIVILPKDRDPRLITIRRGGTLTDTDHHLHALWAATCADHVLRFFESMCPSDPRPREAIEAIRAWTRGELAMMESRAAGGHAMGAAREVTGAARNAAYAAGQAACVAHVAEHNLGAAAYGIKAVRAGNPGNEDVAGRLECAWQREQLPDAISELVIEDQQRRNDICWRAFDPSPG